MKYYFQVKVHGILKAVYTDIDPCLDKAKFYLQDAEPVVIEPVQMTSDEYLEITDRLLAED